MSLLLLFLSFPTSSSLKSLPTVLVVSDESVTSLGEEEDFCILKWWRNRERIYSNVEHSYGNIITG